MKPIKHLTEQFLISQNVDNEKWGLRVFVKTDRYTGATKREVRFYLFDNNWIELKKLIDKVDGVYEEID